MRAFVLPLSICFFVGCATAEPIEETDAGGPVPEAGSPDVGKTCPGTQKACGSVCTDVSKDVNNCGACGTKCAANQLCSAGKCTDNCNPPSKLCGQFCVDLTSDHDNCGKCGMGCLADQECKNGACIKKCPQGLTLCDMDCVNTINDPAHCGDCNTSCAQNEICTGSLCCKSDQVACNGVCTSILTDANNCGQCGFACGGGTPYCLNGKCGNQTGGTVRDVNGNILPVIFVPCGNGQISSCTETAAETSCTNLGKKLISHASNGTNAVVSLGATVSCQWSIGYFTNLDPNVAGQCLVGVSNAQWSQCCGLSSWHGNIVTVPQALNQTFGYIAQGNSGYNAMLPNQSGTTWGCQGNGTPPPPRQGCGTYYVACK